jgi:hypothetical protein
MLLTITTSGSGRKMGGSDITSAQVPRQAGADQTGAFFVLRFEAKRAELLRALVRDAVEFAVSDSRPGPHHPVGGLVGHRARMMARV